MMPRTDHHSEYLARAVAALTPEGRRRVDELLEQLAEVVGGHEQVLRFARPGGRGGSRAENVAGAPEPGDELTSQELDVLIAGFKTIRDREPLDDVGDWANAVLALLVDERRSAPHAE